MTRFPGTPEADPALGEAPRRSRPSTPSRVTASRKVDAAPDSAVVERSGGAEGSAERAGPISPRNPGYVAGAPIAEKYRLKKPIGSGGMGEVWVAHHLTLDIDVAIKFIGKEEGAEGGNAERLLEEARTTARLGHPSIVRALDFGQTAEGDPFIVLELLDGEDLASLLEREGKVPAERAVATLLPIAHALSVVHENQIVHRDVKPENVFLARAEAGVLPKLLDFGIARKTNRVRRLTARDTALGTPDYMSPQQAKGDTTDAGTDQWSFGVVLYETVAGARPFEAENYNALLRAIIEFTPKSLLERGVLEPELWRILLRIFEKEPARRYPSMREVGEALARWLVARGINEDAAGTSLHRVWLKEESVVARLPAPTPPAPVEAAPAQAPTVLEGAPLGHVHDLVAPEAGDERTESGPRAIVAPRVRSEPSIEPRLAVEPSIIEAPPSEPPGALESSPRNSEPEIALAAIAELHRGGEPEERFRRAERRRTFFAFALLIAFVFGAVLAILIGTGIVELPG